MTIFKHPHFHLGAKIFSLWTLRFLLIWGVVMGSYHGLYFIINLSERLPIQVERVFLFGYLFWGLLGLVLLGKQLYSIFKNFPHFLEENFDLGFKWFNALDQFLQPTQVPFHLTEKIFSGIGWEKIWEQISSKSNLILSGLGAWLLYPLLAISLPEQHSRFTDNIKTLWNYQKPYLSLEYPHTVLQNKNYQLTFKGDYREGVFKTGGREWKLLSGESFIITNVINSFILDYRLEKGRISKTGSLPVQVILPPQLISQIFTVQPPFSKTKPYTLEGVYDLIANSRSRIRLLLKYQEDQEISTHEVKVLIPESGDPSLKNIETSQPTPNQLQVDLILNQSKAVEIQVQNHYGQWSDIKTFNLNVRKNQPPSVTITEPESLAQLNHPRPTRIGFLAKDDVSLETVTLYYQIVSENERTTATVNLSPQVNSTTSTTLWVSNFTLPLNNLIAPPGTRVNYYLRAQDLEGGSGYSSTNSIHILTSGEIYTQSVQGGEHLRDNLDSRQQDFNNLERDYEKLKILSETKKIDLQDIKNFQNNVQDFSEKMQEDITKIEELEEDSYENKQIISESFKDKLLELKESLENLDKDFLQKMNQRFQTILNKVDGDMNPEEVGRFLESIDLKQMEDRVEQTLLYLNNLKRMQKIDAIEQLSQNLYLRYKDLESYIIADLLTPKQVHQEATSIKEGLEFIKKEFSEIASEFPSDPRVNTLKKNISNELAIEKISAFEKLSQNTQDDDFLKKRSDNLDQLRRNLARLNSQNQNFNQAELLATLNTQIFSLNRKIEWLERLENGMEYDLNALEDMRQLELITQFLSKHKTTLFNYREQIFLLSSVATLELDFIQHYDKAIDKIEEIQRRISPDQQQPNNNQQPGFKFNFTKTKNTTLSLSRELILLKNILSKMRDQQQQNLGLNRAMEMQRNLNQRIQKMLQRGDLSEREKQYLKNMALEQSLLRSLMEAAEDGGQPNSEQENGGQGQDGRSSPGQGEGEGKGQQGSGYGEEGNSPNGSGGSSENGESGEEGKMSGQDLNSNGSQTQHGENNRNETSEMKSGNNEESPQRRANRKRREIIDKMRQLERELLRTNPDLAKIQELQKSIEDNLFNETYGLQSQEKDQSEERLAERDNVEYQKTQNETYIRGKINKTDPSVLDKLRKSRLTTPPEFQDRIRRFLELNSIP